METEFSELSILNKDTDTVNTKNCSYCNKPFTEKVWCKECINSLAKLAENGDEKAMFNLATCYHNEEGTENNLEKAFHWYHKAAENNFKEAMFKLAKCYDNGEGAEKNLEKAFYWYQKAAQNGHEDAMFNLAKCYENGEGTEKNLEEAFYWYQKLAEYGDIEAIISLAMCYDNGEGTEKNLEKALYWYQKAAENGDVVAMYNVAIYYDNGEGTEKNLENAFYWYQKAAENGDVISMFNLALCYESGKGTKKNLEKAFYWYQKAAENGDKEAMFNLAYNYENREGTEKSLEKAFYWYQKAAENGYREAMAILADFYNKGIGTEKNLEKAFYWDQKAAEDGHVEAMFNLAYNYYESGEGTEINLEKAFYWYQKAAVNDHVEAMFNLAIYYEDEIRTEEKNLEKAFYWYQKAAESGYKEAMFSLSVLYEDGKGTEKNLEKAFYWYQKAKESNKILSSEIEVELCNECKQPYIDDDYQWCQQCNIKRLQQDFSKWTCKNEFINKFIEEAQLKARNSYEILEWIPYNKLSNINYYDKGGFSEIHKAIWSDGPIYSWNFDKQQWNRQADYEIILKILNNSSSLDNKFLDEWKYHYNCQKKSFSKLTQIFGFTQDPVSLNYIIVMSYAKKGSLRKCLSDINKFKWQDKLQLLKNIILGLKVIHESGLTHGDFHDKNILMSDNSNEIFIIDLGLCKPINDDNGINEIYGVLPYMAPEILRNNPYTQASDIYSFSMIMWEFTSGIPPFKYEAHDHNLVLSICEGERPEIIENTPKCYIDLMKRCWDSNPSNRPTIIMLENIISEWIRCINKHYNLNRDENSNFEVLDIDSQLEDDMLEFINANEALVQKQAHTSIIQSHPQACYKSRKLSEIIDSDRSEYLICTDISDNKSEYLELMI
ncbi:Skt5p [Rhizophagus irregularis DAOM 197198w]|uniref:Skt5p n=3 Tax=Rhizophagus irregularis TaxID=588596 RepID=A0A015KAY8_RHIIW|nr:Skt5p [Rhizophagus irregularis DAOM 197198w]